LKEEVAERFLHLLKREIEERIVIGPPLHPDTKLGPLVSLQQKEKVSGFVERAVGEGATLFVDGERCHVVPEADLVNGFYHRPIVLTDIDPRLYKLVILITSFFFNK